jgi:tetratricopeptide (TPR) repeat protein
MTSRALCFLSAALAMSAACAPSPRTAHEAGDHHPPEQAEPAGPAELYHGDLGTVDLPVSCNEEAAGGIATGLALMHHMMYDDAEPVFAAAAEADPSCAMALWGQAMAIIHPLWSEPPTDEEVEQGRALVERARSLGAPTPRESGYVEAVGAYFDVDAAAGDEMPRKLAWAEAWRGVHEDHPEDPEVALFYSLALTSTAAPADKTYAKQLEAGAIAERVLAERPDHPGAHHYVIHAYDYPPLAERALAVARNYGTIAPEVPHALHMPSHIFTRLGLWDESIDWNSRSAEAAFHTSHAGVGMVHHLHALDYLAYAYLQQGRDREAAEVLESMAAVEGEIGRHPASAYPLAAIPARLSLERGRWEEAAALVARQPATFDWDAYPQFEALTHFARALGAARAGDAAAAREALAELRRLHGKVAATPGADYWAATMAYQLEAGEAWALWAEGDPEGAVERLRQAAAMEAAIDKHPVTPGEIVPIAELLGDMLLEIGETEEAMAAYQAALDRSQGRFNSLYGAGRAAELAGDEDTAASYYERLLEVASKADGERPALTHAREFVAEAHG